MTICCHCCRLTLLTRWLHKERENTISKQVETRLNTVPPKTRQPWKYNMIISVLSPPHERKQSLNDRQSYGHSCLTIRIKTSVVPRGVGYITRVTIDRNQTKTLMRGTTKESQTVLSKLKNEGEEKLELSSISLESTMHPDCTVTSLDVNSRAALHNISRAFYLQPFFF